MRQKRWRHSRWCQYKNHPEDEPMCDCGHPLCLHQEVYGGTVMPSRTGPCRSRDCEGQCEGFTQESTGGPE